MMIDTTTENAAGETQVSTRGRLTTLWVLAVIALALHNFEEWLLDMTGWIADHPWLPGRSFHGDSFQMALALIIVTAAILLLAAVAVAFRPNWSAETLSCLSYALIINGASHVGLSVVSWSLMPGAITGAAVLIPLGLWTARSLPAVRWTAAAIAITVVAAGGVVFGSLWLAGLLASVV